MAKYKLQELTDMRDEGKRRVYPKMVTNRTLSRKEFVKMMQNYHRVLEVIEKNGVLTLGDYASINNLSRTSASMELKELTNDKTSPIDSLGRGSHKVWVKRKE